MTTVGTSARGSGALASRLDRRLNQRLTERLRGSGGSAASTDLLQPPAEVVFDVVGSEVPFVFAAMGTTDPANGVVNGVYMSTPLPVGEGTLYAAMENSGPDVNRYVDIYARPVPVGGLFVDTGGNPQSCRRLRDYMTPRHGFTDEIRLGCRAHGAIWAVLGIYRGPGDPPFTSTEVALLGSLHEVIAGAVMTALFAPQRDQPARPAHTQAVVVVDGHNRVSDMSAAATENLDELGGIDAGGHLPDAVVNVVGAARAGDSPATARIRSSRGGWMTVTALALSASRDGAVVLSLDAADPASVGRMSIAARGLTAREQEVVGLVLRGASTQEIAHALFLSPHTVQDHLKAVFAKTGVNSRRELIAQLVLS